MISLWLLTTAINTETPQGLLGEGLAIVRENRFFFPFTNQFPWGNPRHLVNISAEFASENLQSFISSESSLTVKTALQHSVLFQLHGAL